MYCSFKRIRYFPRSTQGCVEGRRRDGTIINPRPQRRLWRHFKWNLKRGSWLICRHVLFLLMVFWFSQDDLSGTLVRVLCSISRSIYERASPNDDHKPGPTPRPHNFYTGNFKLLTLGRKAFLASQAFYNIRYLLTFYYDHWLLDPDVGLQFACEPVRENLVGFGCYIFVWNL